MPRYYFSHGDGGGGPNGEMLERLERLRNVSFSRSTTLLMLLEPFLPLLQDGLPTVRSGDPTEFFQRVERYSKPLSSYRGELVNMDGHSSLMLPEGDIN
ncbi:hypothetical protein BC936DRAFT_142629 [Jimgerdemannia flammicorona]|uniref:Uncharacterized protein n=1 Tax=Jimgerdemannia flammicorona TaxID=994334 RepID=A0A433DEV8_9FUNG|nr:hypothetical protein BC936DRAFT_142629 [Jimgerdemannia flammicorona]